MSLMQDIISRAKANPQRIVLPEGTEERTLKAADSLAAEGIAKVILLGAKSEIEKLAKEYGLAHVDKTTIIDPCDNPNIDVYADMLVELRKKKGMTKEKALELAKDPLYLSCLMIKNGDADG